MSTAAGELLIEAAGLVASDRSADYGEAVALHNDIGAAWTVVLRRKGLLAPDATIDAHTVLLCMAALKLVREAGMPKRDNCVDGAGYFALAAVSL